MVTVGRTAAYLFGDFTKRVDQHIFWKLLTQLLARNTFVALAVAMLATKSLITFLTHVVTQLQERFQMNGCFCIVWERRSRRKRNQFASAQASAESKKHKLFLRYRYLRRRKSGESHKLKSRK